MAVIVVAASAASLCAGVAIASQPDMEGALKGLEEAQSHLRRVTQDKGGHASAARKLVADAVNEVQAGIEYGRTHSGE